MSTKIRILDDAPILIVTFVAPVSLPTDPDAALAASAELKKNRPGKICRILDFSKAQLNFGDMVQGMVYERGKEGGVYDPDVYNVFVATGEWLVKMGVESLATQEQYRGANVQGLYMSEAEAIEAARTLLRAGEKPAEKVDPGE